MRHLRFSKASGLHANNAKSAIYIARVQDSQKESMINCLGFVQGALPFKYLGVPLDSKRLHINQYLPLIEKIAARVKCWSAKFISYDGRLQLIKSTLFGVQAYWAQIFLISKKVIKAIEQICRTFLWTGSVFISKKALV